MAIRPFLAMTAAEMRSCPSFPTKVSWMACHFSPYSLGLSNLPRRLPPDSLLILDDITPIHGHDPQVIANQLVCCADALKCAGVLLDFQRPKIEETAALTQFLAENLPCPVAVSDLYADGLTCPVFLPPPPCHVSLSEYLAPWQSRALWLEMALDGEVLTVTEEGCAIEPLPPGETYGDGHAEEKLHCHYHIHTEDTFARFTLFRTREDLEKLLEEAEALGVTTAVGLYQELQAYL